MWQSTPFTLPCLVIGVFAVVTGAWVFARRHDRPGARELVVFCAAIAWADLAYAGQLARADIPGKDFFLALGFVGLAPLPVAHLALALRFSGRAPLAPKWMLGLSVPALVFAVLGVTNGWHHWLLGPSSILPRAGYTLRTADAHPLFWAYAGYAYGMCAIATIALGATAIAGHPAIRRAASMLFFGALVPWVAEAVSRLGFVGDPAVQVMPMAIGITIAVWAWVIGRGKLLDLVPVAREAILESMRDAFVVLDKDGRILDANAVFARIAGSSARSLIGRDVAAIGALSELGRVEPGVARELSVEDRWYEVMSSRVKRDAHHASALVLRDVSERHAMLANVVAARDCALAADRAKGEFLARMSHELRTPLHGILGAAELLTQAPLDPKDRRFAEGIVASGEVLLRVLTDILDFARLGAGAVAIDAVPFDPSDLVGETIALFAAMAAQKGVALRARGARGGSAVVGDAKRLRQALFNVVANAVKFTDAGSVEVSWELAERDGGAELRIEVQDTGIGIPHGLQGRIFEPFVQADGGLTRKHAGTGLGLTIALELVRAMGGGPDADERAGRGHARHVPRSRRARAARRRRAGGGGRGRRFAPRPRAARADGRGPPPQYAGARNDARASGLPRDDRFERARGDRSRGVRCAIRARASRRAHAGARWARGGATSARPGLRRPDRRGDGRGDAGGGSRLSRSRDG